MTTKPSTPRKRKPAARMEQKSVAMAPATWRAVEAMARREQRSPMAMARLLIERGVAAREVKA